MSDKCQKCGAPWIASIFGGSGGGWCSAECDLSQKNAAAPGGGGKIVIRDEGEVRFYMSTKWLALEFNRKAPFVMSDNTLIYPGCAVASGEDLVEIYVDGEHTIKNVEAGKWRVTPMNWVAVRQKFK